MARIKKDRENEYIDELSNLDEKYVHYVTPGARAYFKRMWIGYVVLAVAGIFGIWGVTEHSDRQIRRDINSFAKASCLMQRQPNSTLNKYNRLVEVDIQNLREARKINMARGDDARVKSNTKSIIRLQTTKIPIPSERECNAHILPE